MPEYLKSKSSIIQTNKQSKADYSPELEAILSSIASLNEKLDNEFGDNDEIAGLRSELTNLIENVKSQIKESDNKVNNIALDLVAVKKDIEHLSGEKKNQIEIVRANTAGKWQIYVAIITGIFGFISIILSIIFSLKK